MLPEEIFVFCVAIGAALLALLMLTSAYKRRLDFKLRKAEIDAQARTPPAAPADDRAELLEDRVRVLERIATDRGQDIAHQIEALRDQRTEPRVQTRKAVP
jgi:hypothetical protein